MTDARIQPATWLPPKGPIFESYRTTTFPTSWVDAFGRGDRTPPLIALATAARTVAPGIRHTVPVGARTGDPFLWADADAAPAEDGLAELVSEWIGVAFDDERRPSVQRAAEEAPLAWSSSRRLELARWAGSPNGTAEPRDPVQFQLLADHAARVLEDARLAILGSAFTLHRLHRGRATEPTLVSWPPFAEQRRRRSGTTTELWSVQLQLKVITVAWDERPRVAIEWSRRRFLTQSVEWVADHLFRERANAVAWWPKTAPLKVGSLIASDRLVEIALRWSRPHGRLVLGWDDATGRLLDRLDLSLNRDRLDPTELAAEPLTFGLDTDQPTMLVTFRNGIEPASAVGAGYWQCDHALLHAAVDDLLTAAGYQADASLHQPLRPTLRKRSPRGVRGRLEIWSQTPSSVTAAVSTVDDLYGPATEQKARPGQVIRDYLGGDLTLAAFPMPGEWSQPLDRDAADPARARVEIVRAGVPPTGTATAAIVELAPKDAWRGRREEDPYVAVKRGMVLSGRCVQGLESPEAALWRQADMEHRAKHATLDALRQLGAHLTFGPELEPLPGGLRQVSIVPVQRNAPGPGRAGVYPVVLIVEPDGESLAMAFGDREPQPLPTVVCRFGTGDVEPLAVADKRQQLKQWASFVDHVVSELIDGPPTLLVLERHSTWWRTLSDKYIERDVFTLPSGGDEGKLRTVRAADARNLRVVRVDHQMTPRHVGTLVEGNVLTTHGVYRSTDRRYLSRGKKPKTRQVSENRSAFGNQERRALRGTSAYKAGDWIAQGRDPFGDGWNPSTVEFLLFFLQPDDDPDAWATYLHAQRHLAVQFDDPLQVPVVMHNARLAQKHLELVDDGRRRVPR